MVALSTVLIVAYGVATFRSEQRSYHRAVTDAAAALEKTVRSGAIGTDRTVSETAVLLLAVQRIVDALSPTVALESPALQKALQQFTVGSLPVRDILIFDVEGHVVNRANVSAKAKDEHRGGPAAAPTMAGKATLHFGVPERNAGDASWTITVSRRLTRRGAITGDIVVEVPIAAFADLYASLRPDDGTHIGLLRGDGVVIASAPSRSAQIGTLPQIARSMLARAAQQTSGVFWQPPRAGRGGALRAFARVSNHGLIVFASRAQTRILERWRRECAGAAAAFGLFALTVTALAWLAVRALRGAQFAAAFLRRSEARLRRQNVLLQSTLDSLGEGLSVFDDRGRLIARNRRFCELLDLPTDLPGAAPLRDILMRQALRGDFGDTEPQAEVGRRLEAFYREVPIVKERLTLTGRTLQIRRSPMPGRAVVSVYSDITELKASQSKLLEARSQAEFANHAKSEFLANMSHELRTPLNAIIGFTEVIAQELFGPVVNPKYLEYIKDVHASSLHLLSIINDVLDMSKIEAGKLELQTQAVVLQDVIADAVRIVHERASARGIEFVTELPGEPIVIWGDERSLKQICLNLLSNAIKFSRPGGAVGIRVSARTADVTIEVEDYGIGMDADEQVRALQPFGQAKPTTTREYGGTGLGLPITKGLVEAHGGTLVIFSRPGQGTMVRVVLPLRAASPGFADQSLILANLTALG